MCPGTPHLFPDIPHRTDSTTPQTVLLSENAATPRGGRLTVIRAARRIPDPWQAALRRVLYLFFWLMLSTSSFSKSIFESSSDTILAHSISSFSMAWGTFPSNL